MALASGALGLWVTLAVVGFVVINQLWIDPHTSLFRRQSDPGQPPASHTAHAVFGDTLELLGYDLESTSAAAGQTVRVTLYWRVAKPTNIALSVAVHLTGLNGRGDWGGVSSLNPGDLSTDVWPTDRYSVNTLQFNIAPNAPPYVGELRISVFKQPGIPTLEYLKDSDGQNSFALTSFRVDGMTNAAGDFAPLTATNINFGNAITLAGYQLNTNAGGQQCIRLRWEAQADGTSDDTVMLHVLNAQNQMLNALDAPPLDGLYPTSAWRKDQVLYDTHCFDRQPGMTTVLVGLYRQADTTRLTATTATGDRLPDDGATIALP
jgi:hypothetical protein